MFHDKINEIKINHLSQIESNLFAIQLRDNSLYALIYYFSMNLSLLQYTRQLNEPTQRQGCSRDSCKITGIFYTACLQDLFVYWTRYVIDSLVNAL